jgi:hypothetical protein
MDVEGEASAGGAAMAAGAVGGSRMVLGPVFMGFVFVTLRPMLK